MLSLNYKEYGAGGKPLIILHGFLGSLDNWHTLATGWSEKGLHVYSLDLRNHGRSPHTGQHSIRLMSGDLKDFMDQQGLKQASLLGHSMGGKVVMDFALNNPAMVNRLIVADIAPREYKRGHDDVFEAIKKVNLSTIQSRKEAEAAMMPYLGDSGTRQFILKNLDRNEDGTYRWKFNFETLYRDYEHVTGPIESAEPFNGDTLFIRGGLSLYIQDKDLPRIRQLFPKATIRTIEQAGHWVHAEKPKEFSDLVINFTG